MCFQVRRVLHDWQDGAASPINKNVLVLSDLCNILFIQSECKSQSKGRKSSANNRTDFIQFVILIFLLFQLPISYNIGVQDQSEVWWWDKALAGHHSKSFFSSHVHLLIAREPINKQCCSSVSVKGTLWLRYRLLLGDLFSWIQGLVGKIRIGTKHYVVHFQHIPGIKAKCRPQL